MTPLTAKQKKCQHILGAVLPCGKRVCGKCGLIRSPRRAKPEPKCGDDMGRSLFATVQASQGFSFISDDVEEGKSPEEVRQIARNALAQTVVTTRLLRRWLAANR